MIMLSEEQLKEILRYQRLLCAELVVSSDAWSLMKSDDAREHLYNKVYTAPEPNYKNK